MSDTSTQFKTVTYPLPDDAPKSLILKLTLPCVASILTAQAAIGLCNSALTFVLDSIGIPSFLALATSAVSLGVTMAAPVGGKLSDILGRRKTIIYSLVPYVICLMICTFVKSPQVFLGSYLLSSLFLGNISGVYTLMMMDVFQGEARAAAIGLIPPGSTIAALGATFVGGWIVDYFNPVYCFLFLASFAIVNIILVIAFFPDINYNKGVRKPFDFTGTLFMWLFVVPITLVFSTGGKLIKWDSAWIPILSVVGIISLFAFMFTETKAKDPVVDPRIFKIPGFTPIVILCAFNYINNAVNTYLNIFGAKGLGYTGTQVAMVNLLTLLNLVIGPAVGIWVGKTKHYRTALQWSAVFGVVFCIVTFFVSHEGVPLFVYMLVRTLSLTSSGIFVVTANVYRSLIIPAKDRGTAQGGYYMIYNLTNVIFASCFGLMMNNVPGGILVAFKYVCLIALVPNVLRFIISTTHIPKTVTPVDNL